MGNQATRNKAITTEFNNIIEQKRNNPDIPRERYLCKKKGQKTKPFLCLDDVLNFKYQTKEKQIEQKHLGTLFLANRTKDGRFFLDDIISFVDLYYERQKTSSTVDTVKEFQGYCTARLWNFVNLKEGKQVFITWFGRLFSHGHIINPPEKETKTPEKEKDKEKDKDQEKEKDRGKEKHNEKSDKPGTLKTRRDSKKHRAAAPEKIHHLLLDKNAVKNMHEILHMQKSYGIDPNKCLELMTKVAHEMNLPTSFNGVPGVPIEVFHKFGEEFITGFITYMYDLGFENNLQVS